jgi:hypothetical protein
MPLGRFFVCWKPHDGSLIAATGLLFQLKSGADISATPAARIESHFVDRRWRG